MALIISVSVRIHLRSADTGPVPALDFLANSPMSLGTIEDEVDRYIGMPGQALAYMIGRLEFMRMRAEAEAALGVRFDIKGFHDTVLGSGLVPMPTLDRMVKDWVTAVV
jgi:uncharacterized protein (DUF885 family)